MIIETKYNVGDIVWAMLNNKPCELEIYSVEGKEYRHCDGSKSKDIVYRIGEPCVYGSAIFEHISEEDMTTRFFASKDELRKSVFGE